MPTSVTHQGIVGQTTFRPPFIAAAASELTVTVAGSPAAFSLDNRRVVLTTPLAVNAEVTIADARMEIGSYAKTTNAGASAQVVPAKSTRKYAKVFNDGATVKRFAVGVAASSTVGIPVAPNTGYVWPTAPTEAINVYCSAAESYQYEGD